jgi:hypothetical protein
MVRKKNVFFYVSLSLVIEATAFTQEAIVNCVPD